MGSDVHRYALYGLGVESRYALEGLRGIADVAHDAHGADVRIVFERMRPEALGALSRRTVRETRLVTVHDVGDGAFTLLEYAGGPAFLVDRAGTEVRVLDGAGGEGEGVEREDVLRFLLGSVMGLVLRRRGVTCVHGATLACRGCGFVLIAPSGGGKSTLAAALLEHDCTLVSDDVLALTEADGAFLALPGIARVRLWQDAADALLGEEGRRLALGHSRPKRLWDLTGDEARLHHGPCPLRALYVLHPVVDAPAEPRLEVPEGGRLLVGLLANTYPNPEHFPLTSDVRAREFDVLGRLAQRLPVRRVVYRRDLSVLPALCRTILGDFELQRGDAPCPTTS